MINTINLNVKMNKDLKDGFEKICDDKGLSMTSVINIFVKKVVKENKIPFIIKKEIPNGETIEAINEIKKIKKSKKYGKTYSDPDEMIKDLLVWNIN